MMEKSEIDRKKKDKKADLVRYRPPGRRGSGGDVLTDSGRLTNSDGKSTDFSFGSDPTEPRGNRIKGAEKIKSKVFEKRNVSEDFADVEQKQNIVEAKKPNVQEDINLRHASEEKSQIGMKKVSERRQPYGGPRVQQQRGAGVDKIRNEEIPLSFPNEPKDVRSQQGERRHSQQQRPHQAVDRGQQRHQPNYDRREPMHSRGSSFTMSDVRLDQSHLVDPVQVRQEHSNGPGDLRTHQGGQKLKRKSNRPKRAGPGELNFHRGKPSEQQQQPIAVRDTSKNQLEDIDLDIPRCFVSSRTKDMPQKDWKEDFREYERNVSSGHPAAVPSSNDVRMMSRQRSQEETRQQPQSYRPKSSLTLQVEPSKVSSSTKSNTNKRPALTPVSPIDDWGAEVERSEKQEKSQRTVSPPPDPFSTRPTGRQPGVLILPKQMPPQESHGIQIRDYMGPSHYRNDWRQQSSSVSPPLADHFHPREARRREREQQSHMVEPYDGQDQYNYARAGPPSQRRVANDNDPEVQIARLKEMLAVNEGRMEQLYGAAKMNYSIDVNLMSKIRREIQDLYEQLLGFDQLLNSGLDEKIFRSAFYDAVEVLRLEMVKCEDSQALMAFQKVFLEIIQEGTDTFQRLLERYQSAGDFALVDFVHPIDDSLLKFIEKPVRSIVTRHSKALLKSCQRFLIALGDLARYKELELKTQNFGRSRAYYLRAAQLIPSNGHSFSQLGLLALYTHRRLDAIYYLSRSLCAKTPFSLAANPLVQTFQEVEKRYLMLEDAARCELVQLLNRVKGDSQSSEDFSRSRREVWIRLDGTKETGRPEEFASVPSMLDILIGAKTDLLHRRFIAYFLRLSGMIYSKIGMELFEELAEKILVQLRELLSRTQSPLTSMELVQVVTISFFCVFHALRKTNVTEKNASSQLQESAVRFSISLFGLLLERLNEVMSEETVSVPGPEGQLHLVLPAIRVFSSWLSLCKNEYTDVVCNPFETENFTIDTWGHLAKAANFISRLKLDAPTPLQKPSEVHHILPEDLLMCGFLVEFCKPVYYAVIGNKPAEVSAQFARLVSVVELGDYLDGSKFAFFCVDPTTEQYKSKGHTIERHTKSRNRRNTSDAEVDEMANEERRTPELTDRFGNLTLEGRKRAEQQKQEILAREAEKECRVVLEICPKVLIPDTNTFIDHLPLIQKIIQSGLYTVTIPCIVLVELEGLKKRRDSEWVPKQASKTLEYLADCSATGQKKLTFITTKGSEVEDIKFAIENQTERMTADDGILKCCLTKIQDGPPSTIRNLKDEPLKLQRSCVLLTDDRNLRVKAIMQKVPVKTVPAFMDWAKL